MKKFFLTAAAVFAFSFANAQDVKFGAKAGLNISSITGDDTEDLSSKIGFQVGGFAEIKISDKFAIQPELLYSAQGAKAEYTYEDYDVDTETFFDVTEKSTIKLAYLNIPVMAKYYVTEGFSLEAGPQIGFLMSAKEDSEDRKEFLNSTDFGFNVGAGYNLNEQMSLGLRYNIGLSDIEKDLDLGASGSKNSSLQLSLSLHF